MAVRQIAPASDTAQAGSDRSVPVDQGLDVQQSPDTGIKPVLQIDTDLKYSMKRWLQSDEDAGLMLRQAIMLETRPYGMTGDEGGPELGIRAGSNVDEGKVTVDRTSVNQSQVLCWDQNQVDLKGHASK